MRAILYYSTNNNKLYSNVCQTCDFLCIRTYVTRILDSNPNSPAVVELAGPGGVFHNLWSLGLPHTSPALTSGVSPRAVTPLLGSQEPPTVVFPSEAITQATQDGTDAPP
jgi:hypothetical protein